MSLAALAVRYAWMPQPCAPLHWQCQWCGAPFRCKYTAYACMNTGAKRLSSDNGCAQSHPWHSIIMDAHNMGAKQLEVVQTKHKQSDGPKVIGKAT